MMRLTISIAVAFVFCIALVSSSSTYNETIGNQTNWFVDIEEGLGFGTGDAPQPQPQNNTNSTEDDEDDEGDYPRKLRRNVSNKIKLSTNPDKVFIQDIKDNVSISNNSTTEGGEVAKEPINWTPIVIWGMVIVFVLALLIGGWYIYQIYFY